MKTIYSIICAICIICGFTACSKDHTGSIDVSGECLVEKFVLNGQYEGTINTEKRQVKVKVPVDFNQNQRFIQIVGGRRRNLESVAAVPVVMNRIEQGSVAGSMKEHFVSAHVARLNYVRALRMTA